MNASLSIRRLLLILNTICKYFIFYSRTYCIVFINKIICDRCDFQPVVLILKSVYIIWSQIIDKNIEVEEEDQRQGYLYIFRIRIYFRIYWILFGNDYVVVLYFFLQLHNIVIDYILLSFLEFGSVLYLVIQFIYELNNDMIWIQCWVLKYYFINSLKLFL